MNGWKEYSGSLKRKVTDSWVEYTFWYRCDGETKISRFRCKRMIPSMNPLSGPVYCWQHKTLRPVKW